MGARTPTARAVDSIDRLLIDATAVLTAAEVTTPRLDAEVLLAWVCAADRAALYARGNETLPADVQERFRSLLARRAAREPLQYIVGRQEFWSLDFAVTPDVLIPRPETELLVESALEILDGAGKPLRLCDLGTGSGCIAVALAHELPNAEIWALDCSPAVLAVAESNARRHGVAERIHFVESDIFADVPEVGFDAIVSNPPYVAAEAFAALQPELAWEPRRALEGGREGLDVIGRILAAAPACLSAGGWVAMEIGSDQGAAVAAMACAAGFSDVDVRADYAGLPRVLLARRG